MSYRLRRTLVRGSQALGVTRLVESLPKTPSMLALTYHRIGNPRETEYDPGVFSADQDDLAQQIDVVKRSHDIIGIEEAMSLLSSEKPLRRSVALLTFDDGYRDNFTKAAPVLDAAKAPAVFFLVTDFLDGGALPWWDQIAYLLKHAKKSTLILENPHPVRLELDKDLPRVIAAVLRLFRLQEGTAREAFIRGLEAACERKAPTHDRALMMGWDEARQLARFRIDVGAHTVTHPILSNVPQAQQEYEILESRRRLEQELGLSITSFAYPVGYRGAFSSATQAIVKSVGYRFAFSYYGGNIDISKLDPLDVPRFGVSLRQDLPTFRFQVATYPFLESFA